MALEVFEGLGGGGSAKKVSEIKRGNLTTLSAHWTVVAPSLTPDSYNRAWRSGLLFASCSSLSHPG